MKVVSSQKLYFYIYLETPEFIIVQLKQYLVSAVVIVMITINICGCLFADRSLFYPIFVRLCLMLAMMVASVLIKQVDIHSMSKSIYLLLCVAQISILEDVFVGSQYTRLLAFGYTHLVSHLFQRFSVYDKFTKIGVAIIITIY